MREWCQEQDVDTNYYIGITRDLKKALKKIPKRMRCTVCKKRFKLFIRECHDPGCWHVYMPKHKRTVKPLTPAKAGRTHETKNIHTNRSTRTRRAGNKYT